MRRAVKTGAVERRLADEGDGLREMPVDVLRGGRRAVVPEHAAEFFEATLGRFVEDAVGPTRVGIEEDDRIGGQG